MEFRSFYLNSDEEVIVKIVKEILNLFKIHITGTSSSQYDCLSILNTSKLEKSPEILTKLIIKYNDGTKRIFSRIATAAGDERTGAAIHRLIKLNLYHIFCEDLSMKPAPWGILHGVRPTKIVHRYIRQGMEENAIYRRLLSDYSVSPEKAACITKLAFRQLPFLKTSDERTVSIYVGIPFCLSRCLYCSFPAYVLPTNKELTTFMSVWQHDLEAVQAAILKYDLKVQNIYVGGGTPTSLPDEYFATMLHTVHDAFYGPQTLEFTVEAGRPDSMSPAKISCMKELSVSRVSVNPQTMQLCTLQRIGRQHTPADIVRMFKDIRQAGIPHINMDLIIGLPGETDADIADTMRQIAALQPDDITLHALALKRGSRLKLYLDEHPGEMDLPGDDMAQKMFKIAMGAVTKLGLQPYYLYRQGYMSGQLENVGC